MRRDLRVLKSILPPWAIAFLRRLRDMLRRGRQLRLQTPRARREAALQELEALPQRPLISLVMPTYKTEPKYLREAVDSVRAQHYPEWELIVVDDGSEAPALEQTMSSYAADPRIRFLPLRENAGISAATNAGLEQVQGEFVGFLDHDDTLTPDALLRVAQALAEGPELDAVYSDSDKLTIGGVRADPFLKPDWSPVYALGAMYIGHLLVVRTAVAKAAGGFDSAFDKIQDFEFMLRVSERTDRIHHIPQILYHWRAIPGSIAAGTEQKSGVEELQARAVSQHLERLGLPARAEPHPAIPHRAVLRPANGAAPQPQVSIVIRGREGSPELERLLRSLERTVYPELEVIVVENGSRAAAHNKGAGEASGEYLLFLAPDTEVVDPAWLSQLVLHASLPDVAAVGPKLVRPDGKVEQAGVAIGLRDPAAPMLAGVDAEGDGYYGALPCSREVSGLSAECMLVRREDFEREGGFLELYACEYEDLDLCQRLARNNRKCVYAATAVVVTHRSDIARRAGSDIVDRALFVDTWYDRLAAGDPYFNRGFTRQRADYVPSGWLEPVHRAVGAMRSR
ncbi:MAG TPA: glycosyltransferase [Solirubrobacterales bacterium]|nr:glycosyltransferase [Solirubrobacterales bacterium]